MKTAIGILLFLVVLSYQNCSGPGQTTGQKENSSKSTDTLPTIDNNGNGYEGKTEKFVEFDQRGQCKDPQFVSQGKAITSMVVNTDNTSRILVENCRLVSTTKTFSSFEFFRRQQASGTRFSQFHKADEVYHIQSIPMGEMSDPFDQLGTYRGHLLFPDKSEFAYADGIETTIEMAREHCREMGSANPQYATSCLFDGSDIADPDITDPEDSDLQYLYGYEVDADENEKLVFIDLAGSAEQAIQLCSQYHQIHSQTGLICYWSNTVIYNDRNPGNTVINTPDKEPAKLKLISNSSMGANAEKGDAAMVRRINLQNIGEKSGDVKINWKGGTAPSLATLSNRKFTLQPGETGRAVITISTNQVAQQNATLRVLLNGELVQEVTLNINIKAKKSPAELQLLSNETMRANAVKGSAAVVRRIKLQNTGEKSGDVTVSWKGGNQPSSAVLSNKKFTLKGGETGEAVITVSTDTVVEEQGTLRVRLNGNAVQDVDLSISVRKKTPAKLKLLTNSKMRVNAIKGDPAKVRRISLLNVGEKLGDVRIGWVGGNQPSSAKLSNRTFTLKSGERGEAVITISTDKVVDEVGTIRVTLNDARVLEIPIQITIERKKLPARLKLMTASSISVTATKGDAAKVRRIELKNVGDRQGDVRINWKGGNQPTQAKLSNRTFNLRAGESAQAVLSISTDKVSSQSRTLRVLLNDNLVIEIPVTITIKKKN